MQKGIGVIGEAVRIISPQSKLTIKYIATICHMVNIFPEPKYEQKIRRIYAKFAQKTPILRIKSWRLLQSFTELIKKNGGRGIVQNTIVDGEVAGIEFVGFIPDYTVKFIHSETFLPSVQLDTRFETGIAKGRLYSMIATTGDRTILIIAVALAPTENFDYTNLLFPMFEDDIQLIKSCNTDEGKGLIKSIEENGITNFLCLYHMSTLSKYLNAHQTIQCQRLS